MPFQSFVLKEILNKMFGWNPLGTREKNNNERRNKNEMDRIRRNK
jgi:hypothetical protein